MYGSLPGLDSRALSVGARKVPRGGGDVMELNARWLQTLDPERLATLLVRRPEASRPAPTSLADLAERLRDPDTVLPALRRLDRPAVQVCEAIVALGGDTTRAAVYSLLGAGGPDVRAAVDAAI